MSDHTDHREDVLQRLRRVQGQVRGLEKLVMRDADCIDVLTQISATTAALQSCALMLLGEHLRSSVADAIDGGFKEADRTVGEATRAIARLVRL